MKDSHRISINNTLAVSFVYGPEDWASILGQINQRIFRSVEIPGEFLDVKDVSNEFKSVGLRIINVEEPLPRPVIGSIYGQDRRLIEKIGKQLSLTIDKISSLNCKNVSIDFGVDSAISANEKKESLLSFIRAISPVLDNLHMNLCIPARIPMPPPATPESYFAFLKETMFGGIRFSADIYPHEITKPLNFEDLLKWYRFDLNIVRFIYEPEAGNLLVDKILENWFGAFDKIGYRGPIIFCPKISSSAHFIRECDRLADLIKSFRVRKKNLNPL